MNSDESLHYTATCNDCFNYEPNQVAVLLAKFSVYKSNNLRSSGIFTDLKLALTAGVDNTD
jgi:hypothetical protein